MNHRYQFIPQFSIRTLLLIMLLTGIGASIIPFRMPAQPADLSDLADSDLAILKRLSMRGLTIQTQHTSVMDEEVAVEIRRCSDRKHHITTFYLQHQNPSTYIDDIASLPELQKIVISDVNSSKQFSICDRANFNHQIVSELVDKHFHNLANYPLSAVGHQPEDHSTKPTNAGDRSNQVDQ